MRISDWSSDVCSSDLGGLVWQEKTSHFDFFVEVRRVEDPIPTPPKMNDLKRKPATPASISYLGGSALDRKSVVSGTSVSVRVDLGGSRIIKKNSITSTHSKTLSEK